MNIKKIAIGMLTLVSSFLLSVSPVFAHAVVKPNTAGIGSFTDFTLGVPSEKDVATVGVKLMLPDGLNNFSPIVKSGWKVDVKTSTVNAQPDDDGNLKPVPVEINWTGGSVPAGQKDFFIFSAQVPAKETELDWKIIQTYADGSTVSWTIGPNDQQPKDDKGKPDFSKFGPFSKTMVVNDLKAPATDSGIGMANTAVATVSAGNSNKALWIISVIALVLGAASLAMQFRKRE